MKKLKQITVHDAGEDRVYKNIDPDTIVKNPRNQKGDVEGTLAFDLPHGRRTLVIQSGYKIETMKD